MSEQHGFIPEEAKAAEAVEFDRDAAERDEALFNALDFPQDLFDARTKHLLAQGGA